MPRQHNRRKFLYRVALPTFVVPATSQQELFAQKNGNVPDSTVTRAEPKRPAPLASELVKEFVSVSHGNHGRVQELLTKEPKLVYASWDHGGGDWETGLGAASHVGHKDIAETLITCGARKDIFAAAMLGERKVVHAMVNLDPKMAEQIGPHGYRVLYHVAISGDVPMAESVLANIKNSKPHLNQALFAAVRGGHYRMTQWLLEQGATSFNRSNAIGEKPLRTATRRGEKEIVDLLRKYGAKELD